MAKRITQLTELAAGSVATDDYLAIVDTSAGQTKKVKVQSLVGIPDFGWTATGETHTYSAWDSTTKIGTITVPTDATTKYTKGMRYRITQTTGGTKYGIIVDVAATSLKVYFGTDYTLNNETITTPFYSALKVPLGFPANPAKWRQQYASTTLASQATPVVGTWYNIGTSSLTVGPGLWRLKYRAPVYLASSSAVVHFNATLSTANNSESDGTWTSIMYASTTPAGAAGHIATAFKEKIVDLSSNTTYYLNARAQTAASTMQYYLGAGNGGELEITAECAYL